ncbi:MAG: alanine--tRNA ligase, partial [Burkholderiaceae bacterium]|nr:alanine--tRNA ligase [Burkholderiaceae bacterium]
AGSENAPGRFRFDFPSTSAVPTSVLNDVESRVNELLIADLQVHAQVMSQDEAKALGAMALFGEKYGDQVRVISVGDWAKELCGGTHVKRTGDIGSFKITSEGGVAAGIRRVEAVTGTNVMDFVHGLESKMQEAAHLLKTAPHDLPQRVSQLQDQLKHLERELERVNAKLAASQGDDLVSQAKDLQGIKVLAAQLDSADAKVLRDTMDALKAKLKSAAIVLAGVQDGKVSLIAGVTSDATNRIKAGELVNFVAQQVGGKGGGKPEMAMAGGSDPSGLGKALAAVDAWVAERV